MVAHLPNFNGKYMPCDAKDLVYLVQRAIHHGKNTILSVCLHKGGIQE